MSVITISLLISLIISVLFGARGWAMYYEAMRVMGNAVAARESTISFLQACIDTR